ncbi:MAG: NTP transferase domain-containing protein, partial [Gemmatimonadota bacterium]|nr:NTP transferase domain-containing protein [Gemmatimonadota bacterium]
MVCVLPARLSSTRIPRKPLQPLADRPLIEWSWRAAVDVDVFDRIVVATDAPEIADCAEAFGAEVVRTREDHASGTDRVEEATRRLGLAEGDLVVNLQADEPFVDASTLGRLVGFMTEAKEGR